MPDMTAWTFEQRLEWLTNLDAAGWDALCKNCGICCLAKIDMAGAILFTNLACDELDLETRRCTCYACRTAKHPGCANIDVDTVRAGKLLPATCAYSEVLFGPAVIQPTLDGNDVVHERAANIDSMKKMAKHIIPESA
jgi:uncharacterized cysteine cluster protein YcgN (CxxCxxCC family)